MNTVNFPKMKTVEEVAQKFNQLNDIEKAIVIAFVQGIIAKGQTGGTEPTEPAHDAA